MRRPNDARLAIPDFALVVLIGATGSGKSSFAARHFLPTEIVSSDHCRGLVADDETDPNATADAFDLVAAIAEKRLKNRRLAVIDATNVRAADRARWVTLARRWHALPVAIVLDMPAALCAERNLARPDRAFGAHVPERMVAEIRRGLRGLEREGFRQVWRLNSPESAAAATVTREPLWTDRRGETGPFDIVGDVHGCADELEALLAKLGYAVTWEGAGEERRVTVTPPEGRKLIFVGDLVDRGPRTPDVLRIVMAMTAAGTGASVIGNHDWKLLRWLQGRKVTVAHGLQSSIDQLAAEGKAFKDAAKTFLDGLRSHLWLDGGQLAVAHAGLKAEMIGRGSAAVREFALYGDTSGEIDEVGLPVRRDWAADYRGPTTIVYGHTPVLEAAFVNNTICIDTACVFGGKLTALRWPERELVEVPAARAYAESARPLVPPAEARSAQAVADDVLDITDVVGRRTVETRLRGKVVVAAENAAAALEAMTRFAIAPHWLVYLPPTMSPCETSNSEGWLERPEEALAHYRERGLAEVVCEEKHMGSRAVIAVARDAAVAAARFGALHGAAGAIWTRTGRPFFDAAMTAAVIDRVAAALHAAGLWTELETDWLLLDAEIMPWSAKAAGLIRDQYAPLATAATAGLGAAAAAFAHARDRGVDAEAGAVFALAARFAARLARAEAYEAAWRPYVWPVAGLDGLKVAPFQVLAAEGHVLAEREHLWHMAIADRLAAAGDPMLVPTRWRVVPLGEPAAEAEAVAWWEELTAAGGEGMVVKPREPISRGDRGLLQPGLKVRGREYLRIIYGPEYDLPENISRLRQRGLGGKRALALREFALGYEALSRFVAREPLRRVHECVFAVLALESEPIDPRL